MRIGLDLDGTLIDCRSRQQVVLHAALTAHRLRLELDEIWRLKREGHTTESALIADGIDQGTAKSVATLWRWQIEEPAWLQFDAMLPAVKDTLSMWEDQGFTMYLVTARTRVEWVLPQLKWLGIDKFFKGVRAVMPDTSGRLKAAVLRDCACEIYFGDTEIDWRAGALANLPVRLVSSGQRSSIYLTKTTNTKPFDSLASAALS